MKLLKTVIGLAVAAACIDAHAVTYKVPADGSRLVGEVLVTTVPGNNTSLESIAAQYQQGFSNMMEANPKVDPYSPRPGSTVIIPQQLRQFGGHSLLEAHDVRVHVVLYLQLPEVAHGVVGVIA